MALLPVLLESLRHHWPWASSHAALLCETKPLVLAASRPQAALRLHDVPQAANAETVVQALLPREVHQAPLGSQVAPLGEDPVEAVHSEP